MSALRTTLTHSTIRRHLVTAPQRAALHIEQRLAEQNITLPTAPTPKANYNIVCHAPNNMLYISGHLPVNADGTLWTGRIGPGGQSVQHGYDAARQAGLNIISTLQEQLGDLDRVQQIVKVYRLSSIDRLPTRHFYPSHSNNINPSTIYSSHPPPHHQSSLAGLWHCAINRRFQGTTLGHGRLFRSHDASLW